MLFSQNKKRSTLILCFIFSTNSARHVLLSPVAAVGPPNVRFEKLQDFPRPAGPSLISEMQNKRCVLKSWQKHCQAHFLPTCLPEVRQNDHRFH